MGVAGTGKTTVGALLAQAIGVGFCDADALHPAANIAKMTRGEPLTDDDRWSWLQQVRSRIDEAIGCGASLVLACSALKRSYRRILQVNPSQQRLIYLRGDKATVSARLRARQGHFMKDALLDSQFEALEEPSPGEALIIDITVAPEAVVAQVCNWLKQ